MDWGCKDVWLVTSSQHWTYVQLQCGLPKIALKILLLHGNQCAVNLHSQFHGLSNRYKTSLVYDYCRSYVPVCYVSTFRAIMYSLFKLFFSRMRPTIRTSLARPPGVNRRDNSLLKEILEWLRRTSWRKEMGANLITSLQELGDFRASQGRRYPLWLILLLVVMGTISGCRSYYALEDFGARHYEAVSKQLG